MDRIALAKRLEGLSSVFASHTPYNRDLKAMSYVLNKMSDDKFSGILSGEFAADDLDACMCGKGPMGPEALPMAVPPEMPEDGEKKIVVIKTDGGMPMSAEASEKSAGMFWCKEASKAVVDNLLRDVLSMDKTVCCDTGKILDKEQIPDGTHKGIPEKPSTLKPEQTPDVSVSLDSDMYKKSQGKVEKEASSAKVEDKDASLADIKEKKKEKEKQKALKVLEKKAGEDSDEKAEEIAEKKEEKAQEKVEEAKEMLEDAEKELEEAKDIEVKAESDEKDASSSIVEGIELSASMDEIELDAGEAEQLSKLFQ
jgi:hypothetical protein